MLKNDQIWIEDFDPQKIKKIIECLFEYISESGLRHEGSAILLRSELILSIKPEIRSKKILLKTLMKLQEINKYDEIKFSEIYTNNYKEVSLKEPLNIAFIIPLNINLDSNEKFHIKFLGDSIDIIPIDDIIDFTKIDDYSKFNKEYNSFINYCQNKRNYIIKFYKNIKPTSSDYEEFDSYYYVFKGLQEFTFGSFGARIWSIYDSPSAVIPFPNWMIEEKNGICRLIDIQTEHSDDAKFFQTDESKFKKYLENCEIFKEKLTSNSLEELLTVSLRLYAIAREAKYSEWAFLGYWQIAEAITLAKEFGGKTDKVVGRLKIFSKYLSEHNIEFTEMLKEIADKRKSLVHSGLTDIDEEIITHLKYHCEVGIRWLLANRKMIPTINHLEKFYSLHSVNEKSLEETLEVIDFIKESRV